MYVYIDIHAFVYDSRVIGCHVAPKEISNLIKYGGLGPSFL